MKRSHLIAIGVLAFVAAPSLATFHFMQIEQVIGGVAGDTTAQAIQLRQRLGGQNLVAQSRIRVFDAAGQNPVTIIDMASNVANGAGGRRILIASANFAANTSPAAAPDFIMTNLIPQSYLAAGSMTFESDGGIVYWRLSWGGAAYTGPNTGNVTNDADGNFGPPFAGPLPSTTDQALRFINAASAPSTNNAADYQVTPAAAVFVNNANASFTVTPPPPPVGACCLGTSCTPLVTAAECSTLGGEFLGIGSGCDAGACQPPACPGARGDANCDGNVDFFDIDAFLLALFDTPAYAAAFCNGDVCAADADCTGNVDFFDIDPFLACLFSGCAPCTP